MLESHPDPPIAGSTARAALGERNLAAYDSSTFDPGRSLPWQLAWYATSLLIFESGWFPISSLKVGLLRAFGAHVGKGVVIKPHVRIKFPWRLSVGNHCWIGQQAWFDNLAMTRLGNHVCVSQGVYLCTGGHDHRVPAFDLITRPIEIADGAWVAARALVLPGVTIGPQAVVAAGSVIHRDVAPGAIVAGNPGKVIGKAESPNAPSGYSPFASALDSSVERQ